MIDYLDRQLDKSFYRWIGKVSDSIFRATQSINVRSILGGILGATAAAIYITSPSLISIWAPMGFILFWASIFLIGIRRPSPIILICLAVIIGSAWIAVPFAAFTEATNLAGTLTLAILTTVLAPLAWIKDAKPIFYWLVPVWLAHAGVSLSQWITGSHERVIGLTQNANVDAAFLLIGCVYLINGNSRLKWLILPLVAAIPFTGSRWVAVVAATVALTLFGLKVVNWRYIAIGVATILLIVIPIGWEGLKRQTIERPQTLSIHVGGYESQPNMPPTFIPRGFYDSGIHVVPWRMAHETGILSAVAWLGATVYALWRRPDNLWWLLLTVGLISAMYYHAWIGPLGWLWWLLISQTRDKTWLQK